METNTDVAGGQLRRTVRELGAAMLRSRPAQNQVCSPASLLVALAMLRAGAGSGTAAELDAVLGLPEEFRDRAVGALLAGWTQYDGDPAVPDAHRPPERPVLHVANGIFVAGGLPIGRPFRQTLAAHFGGSLYQVDFGTPAAAAVLDAWVDRHTGGLIKESPLEHGPGTTLSLMNVISFAAAWAEPFAPAEDEPFTLAGGNTVQVPMMSQVLAANYAAGPGWQAVELPYSEGFLMRLVLPDTGSPVFDAARLAEVEDLLAQGAPAAVLLGLPTWTHRGTLDLVPVLAGLGLAGMAGMEPDFEAIHAQARIGAAAQAVAITVAEQGTVAAAVTEFGLCGSLPRRPEKELVFDRPFLYQIIHAGTGMPLFLGTVMDPR